MVKQIIAYCNRCFVLCCAATLFSSCSKDKLTGEFSSFKGKYHWVRTGLSTGSGLSTTSSSMSSTLVPFTADFEFNSNGEVVFYKDGAVISTNKYSIKDKEVNAFGGKDLIIKLKGNLHGLDIDEEKLDINLSGDSVLSVNKFPFPAIEDVANCKPGFRSTVNKFTRL